MCCCFNSLDIIWAIRGCECAINSYFCVFMTWSHTASDQKHTFCLSHVSSPISPSSSHVRLFCLRADFTCNHISSETECYNTLREEVNKVTISFPRWRKIKRAAYWVVWSITNAAGLLWLTSVDTGNKSIISRRHIKLSFLGEGDEARWGAVQQGKKDLTILHHAVKMFFGVINTPLL